MFGLEIKKDRQKKIAFLEEMCSSVNVYYNYIRMMGFTVSAACVATGNIVKNASLKECYLHIQGEISKGKVLNEVLREAALRLSISGKIEMNICRAFTDCLEMMSSADITWQKDISEGYTYGLKNDIERLKEKELKDSKVYFVTSTVCGSLLALILI